MSKSEQIIKEANNNAKNPFVTATFGDKWRDHARKHYDKDAIIDIAWNQGRRAIMLERAIINYIK